MVEIKVKDDDYGEDGAVFVIETTRFSPQKISEDSVCTKTKI